MGRCRPGQIRCPSNRFIGIRREQPILPRSVKVLDLGAIANCGQRTDKFPVLRDPLGDYNRCRDPIAGGQIQRQKIALAIPGTNTGPKITGFRYRGGGELVQRQ